MREGRGDAQAKTPRLVFASYNVHAWIGMDGVESLGRVLRVVKEINADVVGLQEVSLPQDDSLPISRKIIEDETGMYAAFGPTMFRKKSDFGNVLLSRHQFEAVRRHDITVRSREPRGIVEASIRIHGRRIRVCTTHFGLRAAERTHQARSLARHLLREPTPSIMVGMGDLNDWIPGSPFIRPLLARFPAMERPRTFPSSLPLLALDRVLVRGIGARSVFVYAHRGQETHIASDHLPVVAHVSLASRL